MFLSYHTDLIILKYIMYIDVFQYDIFEAIHGKWWSAPTMNSTQTPCAVLRIHPFSGDFSCYAATRPSHHDWGAKDNVTCMASPGMSRPPGETSLDIA